MLRAVLTFLLAFILVGPASAQGVGKLRILGGARNTYVPANGPGWSGYLATPAPVGNPSDYGYSDPVVAAWGYVPYQTVTGTIRPGIVAYHTPTDAEAAAGLTSNINYVEFSIEGGSVVRITHPALNPDDDNKLEWFPLVNTASFPDGLKEMRACIYPTTGQPMCLQGTLRGGQAGVGSIAGTLLTVTTSPNGDIHVGDSVITFGNLPAHIASFGTGTGRLGTYNLDISPGDVAGGTSISFGDYVSEFFITNANGTRTPPIYYIAAAGTGNDAPGCGATNNPCASPQYVLGLASAGGADATVVVCAKAGTAYVPYHAAPSDKTVSGLFTVQRTRNAPCDGANDGQVTFVNPSDNGGLRVTRTHWKDVTFSGFTYQPGSAVNNIAPMTWLDNVTAVGAGRGIANMNAYSTAYGGSYNTNSTFSQYDNGPWFANLDRNVTCTSVSDDCYTSSRYVKDVVDTAHTQLYAGKGDFAVGNTDVTNVTDMTDIVAPSGSNAGASIFVSGCANSTVASILSANSFRMAGTASGNCTQAQLSTGFHPDSWQAQGFRVNFIIDGLVMTGATPVEGWFAGAEPSPIYNAVITNSTFTNTAWPGGQTYQDLSPARNVIFSGNTWWKGFIWGLGTNTETFAATDFRIMGDTCASSPALVRNPITGATQANPGVITLVNHGLVVNNTITVAGVGGMTGINGTWLVNTIPSANTFTLKTLGGVPVDTTGFGAYTSGGSLTSTSNTPSGVTVSNGSTCK